MIWKVPTVQPIGRRHIIDIMNVKTGNKKSLVLDLDNTLWGGIVGDDGVENLEIGQETPMGQVYAEFQHYLKAQKEIGVMLNVNSKNEQENAMAGLESNITSCQYCAYSDS